MNPFLPSGRGLEIPTETSGFPMIHHDVHRLRSPSLALRDIMAEREGFEPPDGCPSTVFKTAAFDHSATSPVWDDCSPLSFYDLFIDRMAIMRS